LRAHAKPTIKAPWLRANELSGLSLALEQAAAYLYAN
jgi:hypothetical protein